MAYREFSIGQGGISLIPEDEQVALRSRFESFKPPKQGAYAR
jgi:hypothetical protein